MANFNQNKYDAAYKKANYWKPSVLFYKEDEPMIRAAAEEAGQSVGEYIKTATLRRLEEDTIASMLRDGVITNEDIPKKPE